MFCFGRSVSVPSACELVRHEDEVPELEEALAARAAGQAVGLAAADLRAPVVVDLRVGPARPRAADRPEVLGRRQRDDPLGRHPDRLPERRSPPRRGRASAPGSPAWTLTQMRSQSSCSRSWMNSVAYAIAPSLKYWPNEKLPSISKNVRWNVSRPTSSMSGVRKHFWRSSCSGAGGCSRPRKYGICGCIPAVVKSVERSSARGMSGDDGQRRWPFSSKKERKPSRISAVVRTSGHCRSEGFSRPAS